MGFVLICRWKRLRTKESFTCVSRRKIKRKWQIQSVTFLYLSFVALMSSCRNWDSICSSRLHSSASSASCNAETHSTVSLCSWSTKTTAATGPQQGSRHMLRNLCGELKPRETKVLWNQQTTGTLFIIFSYYTCCFSVQT